LNDRGAIQPREWHFLQLTLFIGAWMLLSPLLQDRWITQTLLQVFLLNSVLVTLWANPEWREVRRIMLAVWIVSLGGSLLALAPLPPEWHRMARTAEIGSTMPLLALLAIGILRFVFRGKSLTSDGLFATVAVYLFIAIFFSQLYQLLLEWSPASFNLDVAGRPANRVQSDMLYFSLITLATVGYGDILPVSETARTLAVIEATVGQFYVAVIVAVFVGMYATQRRNT
jgi:voltage-gated potassium channel Kch